MESTSNFYSLISEKTQDFVGRKWVFDEIDNWLSDDLQNRKKYFIITGKAGCGKSTIAARLIEISNGDVDTNDVNYDNDNQIMNPHFQNIKKGFLDASYVISFKDNSSTYPKTLATSIVSQLANKNEFAEELINSTKTSNIYNIDINASQQQIYANTVQGARFTINIQISGSPPALSIFNDLVRIPLQSFLNNNPQRKMVFLVDGLDESIRTIMENKETDSIISILSNLEGLRNVYFILTTRDYENILNKFKQNSLKLDISSKSYINYMRPGHNCQQIKLVL